jgi:hypothetical protein
MAHHEDSGHRGSSRHDGPERARQQPQGRHASPEPRDLIPPGYEAVVARLAAEFTRVHPPEIVSRCVSAARHGAQDVTGSAAPDLVERIARKHLQVLAIVAAERRQRGTLRNAAT